MPDPDVTDPIQPNLDLPERATTALVFQIARAAGIQVRGLSPRRESIETAFLRVIGNDAQDPL